MSIKKLGFVLLLNSLIGAYSVFSFGIIIPGANCSVPDISSDNQTNSEAELRAPCDEEAIAEARATTQDTGQVNIAQRVNDVVANNTQEGEKEEQGADSSGNR